MSLSTGDAQAETLAAGLVVVGLRGLELQADERALLGTAAGAILFDRNADERGQLRALCDGVRAASSGGAGEGPLICVDREGGRVDRLRSVMASAPSAMALGAVNDLEATRAAYRGLGAGARALGMNVVLAPVADVNSEARNPIVGTRSFGDDPAAVSRHVAAAVAGMRDAGVAACAKHFPGHGAADVDSHVGLPHIGVDAAEMQRAHAAPFAAAIDAGVECVMTAHVATPALDASGVPATWSRAIVGDVLRARLGFEGVVVSDDLTMGALAALADVGESAVRAVDAGCDLVVVSSDVESAKAAIAALGAALRSGRLDAVRVARSVERVRRLRAACSRASDTDAYDDAAQRALATRLARRAVTVVRGTGTLPLALQAGDRALVIDFKASADEQKHGEHQTALGRALSATPARVQEQLRSLEPSGHEYKQMLMAAGSARYIIAIARGAYRRELQARAVADLALFGAVVVVIAAAEPYDAAIAPGAAAVIATYGDDDDALAAAADVMLGRAAATGVLPVRLPAHA